MSKETNKSINPNRTAADRINTGETSMNKMLIKANGRLIDTADSKQELRTKASAYEQSIQGLRYKKEYCFFEESDGTHCGYYFTLFDL